MAINQALPIIQGDMIRITKVGYCGRPIPGQRNVIVTDGFIEFGTERETEDGDEIVVKNAKGQVCATNRTDDQFKRFNLTLSLCGVHPESMNVMTGNPLTLDASGDVDGFLQQTGASAGGFAIEVWAGTGGGEDCEPPTDDAVLAVDGEGNTYWYFLFPWVRGGRLGDITINGTDAADIQITGYTGSGAHWGRGPYSVVAGADGSPERLPAPIPAKTHMLAKYTRVAPPKPTNGATSLTLPTPYYAVEGGVGERTSTVTLPDGTTGGTFTLTFGDETTAPIAHDAPAATVQTAVRALGGALGSATVSGDAGGPYSVTYTAASAVSATGTDLEGGDGTVTVS